MFGRKKEKKQEVNVKTYVDGVLQDTDELAVPKPAESGAPAHGPQVAHEPTPQPQPTMLPHIPGGVIAQIQLPPGVECYICFDAGFYADSSGVWHQCPKCNTASMKKKTVVKQDDIDWEAEESDRPTKGNLYEFRFCKKCGARSEIHKKKVKWKCEACGADQEVGA